MYCISQVTKKVNGGRKENYSILRPSRFAADKFQYNAFWQRYMAVLVFFFAAKYTLLHCPPL